MARTADGAPGRAADARTGEDSPRSFVESHRTDAGREVYGIGELASELGITTRAIRFYESKHLITPRRAGSTRVYGPRERARLRLIQRGRAVGLSLREIKQYLDLYGERDGRRRQLELAVQRTGEMIAELESKRANIERTLAELKVIERESRRKLRALGRSDD